VPYSDPTSSPDSDAGLPSTDLPVRAGGAAGDASSAEPAMRDRIKAVACDLLIMHGYRGLRFGEVATALGITRANIHYHFGTKGKLIDEVVADYLTITLREMGATWRSSLAYEDKIVATMEMNRRRYLRFNGSDGPGGLPWSLISRMRLDASLLSARARAGLRDFSRQMACHVQETIEQAQANGEITADAPTRDIVVQIVSIIDSAGPITQDAGSFERLEHLYLACLRVIAHAYGSKPNPRSQRGPASACLTASACRPSPG
jgi:TetR/AcrR family transcriptional repressor of nem operon